MAHYNKILIARGTKSKKTPLLGELFYDTNTSGVYIGTEDEGWKRIGGFDSLVIKGTVNADNYDDIISSSSNTPLEPGDAYIVTGPISVVQTEVTYDNKGNITRNNSSKRVYDNFFKNGQVIVYVEKDVSGIPNSAVLDSTTGYGFITLAGNSEANDLENDVSVQPIAKENEIYDVQSALDWLFNKKIEYKGSTTNAIFSNQSTTYTTEENPTEAAAYSSEEKIWEAIANTNNLLPGEMIVYNGETKKVTVDGNSFYIKKNTAIIMVGSTNLVDDEDGATSDNNTVETTVLTIPLGASDAENVSFKFTDERAMKNENTPTWKSRETGSEDATTYAEDSEVDTVQKAIDNLHQTKADLNNQGKIPLSQIPNTFIGALQYIGTVDLSDQAETLTAIELAKLMQAVGAEDADGWEDASEGKDASSATATLDNGDYVIITSTTKTTNSTDDDAGTSTHSTTTTPTQYKVTDTDGTVLFYLSKGDHVIVNSITYDTNNNITAVTLDHLDTSAAVDAVNGLTGAVEIIGDDREVETSTTDSTSKATIDETIVEANTDNNTVQVRSPYSVLAANTIAKKNIPVSGGGRELNQSDVSINSYQDPSDYKTGDDTTHNTELVGKTSNGSDVVVEFPDASGKMSVTTGDGTEDYLPKYDADGNLIDSNLVNDSTGKTFTIVDDEGNAVLTLNYGALAKLLTYTFGGNTFVRRFDDAEYTSDENRKAAGDTLHTILDDCSVIDGGDWS